jgi:hypothetical protein
MLMLMGIQAWHRCCRLPLLPDALPLPQLALPLLLSQQLLLLTVTPGDGGVQQAHAQGQTSVQQRAVAGEQHLQDSG